MSEQNRPVRIFRGQGVIAEWPAEVERAQRKRTYRIDGKRVRRVPYGRERGGCEQGSAPCHDCCALPGELHVPSCDVERCPACGTQVITCGCVSPAQLRLGQR